MFSIQTKLWFAGITTNLHGRPPSLYYQSKQFNVKCAPSSIQLRWLSPKCCCGSTIFFLNCWFIISNIRIFFPTRPTCWYVIFIISVMVMMTRNDDWRGFLLLAYLCIYCEWWSLQISAVIDGEMWRWRERFCWSPHETRWIYIVF